MRPALSEKHIGERVHSLAFGDGIITAFDPTYPDHPVVVKFDGLNPREVFTIGGAHPQGSGVENNHPWDIRIVPHRGLETRTGYKLFSIRKDGSLGPLFINRAYRVTLNDWHVAEEILTKGYAFRPGWHICAEQSAPHLKERDGRVWAKVEFSEFQEMQRPEAQGGLWFIAKYMKVLEVLPNVN